MKKSAKKYRVAVIGCGQIGALFEAESKREKPASHAGAVRLNAKTELVALVDTNAKNLAAARALFPRATGYASLAECLKTEHPDIVIIATPASARLALITECIRAGVPMLICEKPLAKSTREAKQIEVLVVKSGVTFVLNYQRRFSKLFERVRTNIRKGKFGRIQQVTCYYSNGLYNNGGHIVDALSYLIDDEIISVTGLGNAMNKTHALADSNIDALLTTKKGTRIVLQSFDQKEYGIHDISLYGTKASAVISEYGMSLVETPARASQFAGIKQLNAKEALSLRVPLSNTKDALAHVIEFYEKRRAPVSSATSGVTTLSVLDAIATSARQGGRKTLV